MSLAEVVATGMLAVLLGFVALVVFATIRQLQTEAREAAAQRERG
jgi:hypothetical protein